MSLSLFVSLSCFYLSFYIHVSLSVPSQIVIFCSLTNTLSVSLIFHFSFSKHVSGLSLSDDLPLCPLSVPPLCFLLHLCPFFICLSPSLPTSQYLFPSFFPSSLSLTFFPLHATFFLLIPCSFLTGSVRITFFSLFSLSIFSFSLSLFFYTSAVSVLICLSFSLFLCM